MPLILLSSTVLLMLAVFSALTLIDSNDSTTTVDSIPYDKKIKISIIVGLIHLVWWSIFFIMKKKQMTKI